MHEVKKADTSERHVLTYDVAPIPWRKYSLGYNQVIQKAITEDIYYYPFSGFAPLNMQPSTILFDNKIYNSINIIDSPKVLISIARRKGQYAFVDYPLEAFNVLFQINKNLILDLDTDFDRSYVRFVNVALVTTLPFAIPIYFKLK